MAETDAHDKWAKSSSSTTSKGATSTFRVAIMSRTYRIKEGSDFEKLFARGSRVHLPALSLVFFRHGRSDTRYAVVVGLAVTKRATIRNRLRRQISEYIRRTLPKIAPGYDCAFIVRPPAVKIRRDAFRNAATILLRRAQLLPPHQP